MGLEDFDFGNLPDAFYDDPYPTYCLLRQESPTLRLPGGGLLLTRYDDLNRVYRDARGFSSDKRTQFAPVFGEDSALFEHHTTSLVFNDPPLHTRVRKAIGNALSMRMVEIMRLDLERLVDGLLDQFSTGAEVDLIADFAAAIPVAIIGDLLGVPVDERGPLRRWSLAILGALEAAPGASQLDEGNACVREFLDYLEELVRDRRERMRSADDDIMARLIRYEADGYRLDGAELYHQCIFLLNAGHETTTNLIGNSAELLLRLGHVRAALEADPHLIDTFIEEALRFESPNQLGNRTAVADCRIADVDVPAGTVLTLCIGAANRDPLQFDAADTFDIERNPNPHLAFGAGIHTCAGLHVARLEARTALLRLMERFPGFQAAGQPERARRARFRGFATLPVRL